MIVMAESGQGECQSRIDSIFVVHKNCILTHVGHFDDLGPLYVYDTALRIGAKKGQMPKVVYLHAGTREGAKKLVDVKG
ncbi:MAG: hypothetical protein AAB327_09000, partial [Actinomycetota bacterium]